jgi:hypothetical protein
MISSDLIACVGATAAIRGSRTSAQQAEHKVGGGGFRRRGALSVRCSCVQHGCALHIHGRGAAVLCQ